MRMPQLATVEMTNSESVQIAPLLRRLAAVFYDGLLLLAVILLASALLIPFSGTAQPPSYHPVRTLYLLVVCFIFLGWFWTHGGQTLGMRAWRIRLELASGKPLTWPQAALRYVISLPLWLFISSLSVGALERLPMPVLSVVAVIWLAVDYWPNNWRDRLSRTHVVMSA
jgi:uncharacterized RDD family membrane protein YckC